MRSFPAVNRAPSATQHPAIPLPLCSNLHTGKPSSLVRGPFQVSLLNGSRWPSPQKGQTPSVYFCLEGRWSGVHIVVATTAAYSFDEQSTQAQTKPFLLQSLGSSAN